MWTNRLINGGNITPEALNEYMAQHANTTYRLVATNVGTAVVTLGPSTTGPRLVMHLSFWQRLRFTAQLLFRGWIDMDEVNRSVQPK